MSDRLIIKKMHTAYITTNTFFSCPNLFKEMNMRTRAFKFDDACSLLLHEDLILVQDERWRRG